MKDLFYKERQLYNRRPPDLELYLKIIPETPKCYSYGLGLANQNPYFFTWQKDADAKMLSQAKRKATRLLKENRDIDKVIIAVEDPSKITGYHNLYSRTRGGKWLWERY